MAGKWWVSSTSWVLIQTLLFEMNGRLLLGLNGTLIVQYEQTHFKASGYPKLLHKATQIFFPAVIYKVVLTFFKYPLKQIWRWEITLISFERRRKRDSPQLSESKELSIAIKKRQEESNEILFDIKRHLNDEASEKRNMKRTLPYLKNDVCNFWQKGTCAYITAAMKERILLQWGKTYQIALAESLKIITPISDS